MEKLHAAVARSAFSSRNAKITEGPGALFEGALKTARRCGEKRNLYVKMHKTRQQRTFFEVQMSKD